MVIFSGVDSLAWLSPAPNPVTVSNRRTPASCIAGISACVTEENSVVGRNADVARHAQGQNDRVRTLDARGQKLGVGGVAGDRLEPIGGDVHLVGAPCHGANLMAALQSVVHDLPANPPAGADHRDLHRTHPE
jgi:hypothetical protein